MATLKSFHKSASACWSVIEPHLPTQRRKHDRHSTGKSGMPMDVKFFIEILSQISGAGDAGVSCLSVLRPVLPLHQLQVGHCSVPVHGVNPLYLPGPGHPLFSGRGTYLERRNLLNHDSTNNSPRRFQRSLETAEVLAVPDLAGVWRGSVAYVFKLENI